MNLLRPDVQRPDAQGGLNAERQPGTPLNFLLQGAFPLMREERYWFRLTLGAFFLAGVASLFSQTVFNVMLGVTAGICLLRLAKLISTK